MSEIRIDVGIWFNSLFDRWNLTSWVKKLLKMGLCILVIIVVVLIMVPCLLQCIQQMINKAIKRIYTVQRGGGNVEHQVEVSKDPIHKLKA